MGLESTGFSIKVNIGVKMFVLLKCIYSLIKEHVLRFLRLILKMLLV